MNYSKTIKNQILYKHYSFDLWLTLIKSNPNFKKERALFFFKNFNSKKKKIEEVERIFRQVDLICNSINEKTGKNIDSEEMYLMVIYLINDHDDIFKEIDFNWLYRELDKLFYDFMPLIYNNETIDILYKLKHNSRNTIGILSNTAFIKGSSLRIVLDKLQITQFLDFQLYSDEVGFSKPNKAIFDLMINSAELLHFDIKLSEIIHIGDNPKADIEGGIHAGINVFQINSNDKTILNLLN